MRVKRSALCVELVLQSEFLPQDLIGRMNKRYGEGEHATAEMSYLFSRGIIDAIAPYAVAIELHPEQYTRGVKKQIANRKGRKELSQAVRALELSITYARSQGLFVITSPLEKLPKSINLFRGYGSSHGADDVVSTLDDGSIVLVELAQSVILSWQKEPLGRNLTDCTDVVRSAASLAQQDLETAFERADKHTYW
jgi:hypothetical protein